MSMPLIALSPYAIINAPSGLTVGSLLITAKLAAPETDTGN